MREVLDLYILFREVLNNDNDFVVGRECESNRYSELKLGVTVAKM